MFLLIVIREVANELIYSLLPYHEILSINDHGKTVPLKYTIKQNAKGIEMIAASTTLYGIKSRFIYDGSRKIGLVDFPRKNIRAWILEDGNIDLTPLVKERGFNLSLVKGFSKLAMLHIEEYLKVFAEELEN